MPMPFLDHAEPKVGSSIKGSPVQVKVWFTQKLVAPFSQLQVFDASGHEIDKHDKKVDPSDPALLVVSVPPIETGEIQGGMARGFGGYACDQRGLRV